MPQRETYLYRYPMFWRIKPPVGDGAAAQTEKAHPDVWLLSFAGIYNRNGGRDPRAAAMFAEKGDARWLK